MSDKLLSEITDDDIESARMSIEDTLVWMRDEHVHFLHPGVYVGNGLVIKNRDASSSDLIRLRVNEAIEMAIKHILKKEN
jgi:hypothetical protein